jgi:2-amino-4-hydroxy-6-hydroxymethyldihydropteridine diphosphokinase
MTARRFVLLPLVEIAPDYIHPILLKSNSVLLKECGDSLAVNKKTP